MISMRGGRGLGDALYVQGVARYFVHLGCKLEILTDYPDIFRPLNGNVVTVPFKREPVDRLAHYSKRRGVSGTSQFEDCCIEAGLKDCVEFRIDWKPTNDELISRLKRQDKPIVVVQMARAPFGRSDGYGMEFLPDCSAIQHAIDLIKEKAFLVQIGAGAALYEFKGIDLDLTNLTSVSDVIDIGTVADGFLGFCSFIVPLAESLSKPALLVWSRKGLDSRDELIRKITPAKVLHGPCCKYVIDDCDRDHLKVAVDEFCHKIAGRAVL